MTMPAGPASLFDNAINVVVRREYKVDGNIALYAVLEGRPLEYYHYDTNTNTPAATPRHRSPSSSCRCRHGHVLTLLKRRKKGD
jgi:hypothetical protein